MLRTQVIRGLKWSATSKLLSQAISWFVTIAVIRILTPDDYGLMAAASVVISFISMICEFGLGAALVQIKNINDDIRKAVFGLSLLLGVSLALILVVVSPWVSELFHEPRLVDMLSVSSGLFIISAFAVIPEAQLRRAMDFRKLAYADITFAASASLSTLLLATMSFGVWSLVFGNIVGTSLRVVVLNVIAPSSLLPSLDLRTALTALRFGSRLTVSRLIWQFTSQADIVLAARYLAKEQLGFYSVALQLATLPMQKAMIIINQVAFSAVAKIQDNQPIVKASFLSGLQILCYGILPAMVGLACLAPELIPLLLGEKWTSTVTLIQIMAFIVPLRIMSALMSTFVVAMGRADIDLRNTMIGVLIMPLCFFVGLQYGAIGLASSWLVGSPVVFMINFPRTSKVIGLHWRDLSRVLIKPTVSVTTIPVGIFTLRVFISDWTPWLQLSVYVALGAATFLACTYLIDKPIWDRLVALIRRKSG